MYTAYTWWATNRMAKAHWKSWCEAGSDHVHPFMDNHYGMTVPQDLGRGLEAYSFHYFHHWKKSTSHLSILIDFDWFWLANPLKKNTSQSMATDIWGVAGRGRPRCLRWGHHGLFPSSEVPAEIHEAIVEESRSPFICQEPGWVSSFIGSVENDVWRALSI